VSLTIGTQQYVRHNKRKGQGESFSVDAQLQRYVQRIGIGLRRRVSDRQLPYEVLSVAEQFSNPCTWAFAGGKIAVNRGFY